MVARYAALTALQCIDELYLGRRAHNTSALPQALLCRAYSAQDGNVCDCRMGQQQASIPSNEWLGYFRTIPTGTKKAQNLGNDEAVAPG